MTDRTQRTLWALLAVVAIGLAATTVYLYRKSRTLSAVAELPSGRIAYTAFSETTGIPQLYTCDLQGGDIRPLVQSQAGDLLPVSGPLRTEEGRAPRIAFVRFRSEPGDDSGTQVGAPGGVYVVGSNGGQEREISGGVPRLLAVPPAWSPDGRQVAFAGVEDLNSDGQYTSAEAGIYVGDAQGAQVRRAAAVHATGLGLRWSPQSAQLILQVRLAEAPLPVAHLLDLQTGELASRDQATTVGCWSPGGQYIAAYSMIDREIHVLDTEGEEVWSTATPAGYVADLYWLPATSTEADDEGRFLALCAAEPNTGWGQLFVSSPLIARGAAPTWRALTAADAVLAHVTPSPDGHWAVFTQLAEGSTGMEADLYLLNLEQGRAQQLTLEPGYEGWPAWVPNGRE